MNLVTTRTKGCFALLTLTLCCSIIAMQKKDKGKEKVPPIQPSSLRRSVVVGRNKKKQEETFTQEEEARQWFELLKKHGGLDLELLGKTTPEKYENEIIRKKTKE